MTLQDHSDFYHISNKLLNKILIRSIGYGWWELVEDDMIDCEVGKKILVCRRNQMYNHKKLIIDYITVKTENLTYYGNWEHHYAVYVEGDEPTYLYDQDCYTEKMEARLE